ncbi:MAG TPA: hypothetical protein DEB67_06415, partial [Oceanicaulis sp.]|nr:hypothetical protein [Oceanicaulis sp.]
MRFDGRVAIVTGAGAGLGRSHALELARRGAKVVVNDLGGAVDGTGSSLSAAETVVEEIKAAGGEAIANGANVTKPDEVTAMVDAARETWGKVDILVNNAGTTHRNQPMTEVTEEEYERIFAVNVKSVYLSARHVVPVMKKQGFGVILNVASTAGVRPRPGLVWYNTSKGAMMTATKAMAIELA